MGLSGGVALPWRLAEPPRTTPALAFLVAGDGNFVVGVEWCGAFCKALAVNFWEARGSWPLLLSLPPSNCYSPSLAPQEGEPPWLPGVAVPTPALQFPHSDTGGAGAGHGPVACCPENLAMQGLRQAPPWASLPGLVAVVRVVWNYKSLPVVLCPFWCPVRCQWMAPSAHPASSESRGQNPSGLRRCTQRCTAPFRWRPPAKALEQTAMPALAPW